MLAVIGSILGFLAVIFPGLFAIDAIFINLWDKTNTRGKDYD